MLKKYRVADDVDRLSPILKDMAKLTRFAKATGNQSLGRLAEETYKTCAAMKGADRETAAALVEQAVQMLKQLSTASNRGMFDDATTAQLERNYNATLDAVKSSLADYLKARKASFKGDDVIKKEKLTRVRRAFDDLVWGHKTIHDIEGIISILPKSKKDKALAAFNAFQQSGSKVVDILMEIENERG